MDEAAIVIIILRLLIPLLILRFPITGIGLAMLLDWQDHTYLGQYESYQVIDKWLDLYYLSICAYVALSWKDAISRRLAIGLFWYRLIGVIAITIINLEWVLILFPNMFEAFFIFYILYAQLSKSPKLFNTWKSITPVMIVLLIPKMAQEYVLHIHLPYPNLTPEWAARIIELPQILTLAPLVLLPVSVLIVYVISARKKLDLTKQFSDYPAGPSKSKVV